MEVNTDTKYFSFISPKLKLYNLNVNTENSKTQLPKSFKRNLTIKGKTPSPNKLKSLTSCKYINYISNKRSNINTKTLLLNNFSHNSSHTIRCGGTIHEKTNNIEELQKLLKKVLSENARLKKVNKEILISPLTDKETANDVHSLHKKVVIPDNEKNMNELEKEVKTLNLKLNDVIIKNTKLLNENKKLKASINRYREYMATRVNIISKKLIKDLSNNSMVDSKKASLLNESDSLISSKHIEASKGNIYLDMMYGALKRISNARSIYKLIKTLYQEIKVLLRLHKIGIFIIDPNLIRQYNKEQGRVQTILVSGNLIALAITDQLSYIIKPTFIISGNLKSTIRSNNTIVVPINGRKSKIESNLYLVVQIEDTMIHKDANSIYENEIWVRNEMVLKILCTHAEILINELATPIELNNEQKQQSNLLKFCSDICGERDQYKFVAVVEENLAACLNFEKSCILPSENEKLFMMNSRRDENNVLIVEGMTEMPLDLGITGYCMKHKEIVIASKPSKHPLYSIQVDNALKLGKLESLMVIPLLVDQDALSKKAEVEVVGVLHLINYQYGDISKVNMVKILI